MVTFELPDPVDIPGLGTTTADVCWLGRPAAERLVEEARWAGLTTGRGDDVVTLTPGCVATGQAIRAFLRAGAGVEGDLVAALPEAVRRWSEEPCFGPPAALVRLRGGGDATLERIAAAARVSLDVDVRSLAVPGSNGIDARVDLSPAVVCSLGEWPGVVWANLLALAPWLWRNLVGYGWRALPRLAWGALRAWSLDPFRVGGRLNRIGRGARVHPSAVVEGCWLGDGAEIGPGAVVRGAVLGAGAVVEAQGLVAFAVLGARARVQRAGWVQYGVVDAGASVGGATQLGLLAAGASLKGGSYLMDQRLGGGVRVAVGGRLVPAPLGMLGVGVGARTVIGSGVWVAPGRAVPPDLVVAADPARVLSRIPHDVSGTVVVRDGTLEGP